MRPKSIDGKFEGILLVVDALFLFTPRTSNSLVCTKWKATGSKKLDSRSLSPCRRDTALNTKAFPFSAWHRTMKMIRYLSQGHTGRYPRHLIVSDYTVTFRLQVALSKFRVIQSTPTAKTEWLEDGNWDPCEAIRKRHARWVNSCQERTLNCHSVPSFKTLVPICQASLPKIFLPSRWIKVVSKKMVVEVWIIPSARLLSDVLKPHGSEIFQGLNSCRWQPAIYLAFQPDSSCFEARLASIFTSDRRSHFWLTHSRVF